MTTRSAGETTVPKGKPDVLLIMTDQWNPRMLGCVGHPNAETPNLDALAAEGTLFTAAYTQSPVCMPARGSLASALYPHNHGFWSNFTGYRFPLDLITLFHDIQDAGYTTGKIGKFHYFNPEWGENHSDYEAYYDQLGLDWAQELPTPYMGPYLKPNEYSEHLKHKGLLDAYLQDIAYRFEVGDHDVVRPSPLPPEDHPDGYIAQQALAYIEQRAEDEPMFLCVSFPGPHSPFDAPGEYADIFDPEKMVLAPNVPEQIRHFDRDHIRRAQANYLGKIAVLDHWVGQLRDAMVRRGTWEDALVIFTADHGEQMGSHGQMAKGRFTEESAGIPLIIRWPGCVSAGQQTSALAELIDIYPTIVEAIGGSISPHRFGTSLLPVATGEASTVHDAVFSEIGHGLHLDYMVRTPDYKWFQHRGQQSLFDMKADPYELNDLIDSVGHEAIGQVMRERLRTFLMETQVNYSADYRGLFVRINERADRQMGAGKQGFTAQWLLEEFRQLHFESG